MELEPSRGDFQPEVDRRPRLDEPLPVRLVAVSDVKMAGRPKDGPALDQFYLDLLEFESEQTMCGPVYRSDNFNLCFEWIEQERAEVDMKPVTIEVRSLARTELKLIEAKMEYTRQRGLVAGRESLLLLDPAGNWVELVEIQTIR
ncbi:MAG: hypothetical protein IT446_09550 [Phycisphaerales bacterium]|nr:hypothetical protein [Phycisphaerales bacterium]